MFNKLFLLLSLSVASITLVPNIAISESQQKPSNINLGFNDGVTITLSGSKEIICHAWLDNPTFATIEFLGNIASWDECDSGSAQILHLKRNKDLKLEHIPFTNQSLLTLVTQDQVSGEINFRFFNVQKFQRTTNRLIIAAAAPAPEIRRRQVIDTPVSQFGLTPELLAERIDMAVEIAQAKKPLPKASRDSLVRFSSLLKLGTPEHNALAMSGVSKELVKQILKLL